MRDYEEFASFLEDRNDWSFSYGEGPRQHDCARFCGAGVEAATGANPLAAFAGKWKSRRGAQLVLARCGGMAAAVSTVMTEIPVTMAGRADVGMTEGGQLVLFDGDGVVGVAEGVGLVRMPRNCAAKAWTI